MLNNAVVVECGGDDWCHAVLVKVNCSSTSFCLLLVLQAGPRQTAR